MTSAILDTIRRPRHDDDVMKTSGSIFNQHDHRSPLTEMLLNRDPSSGEWKRAPSAFSNGAHQVTQFDPFRTFIYQRRKVLRV